MFFCHVFLTSCWLAFSYQSIHAHQFEAHLDTKLMTFPINLEKWQLRFRLRGDIKIKLFRVCISRLFIIFWYMLSKPVIATLDRRHYSHYPQFMDPLGIHLRPKFAIFCTSFFMWFFHQIFFDKWNLGEASATHRGKGGNHLRFPPPSLNKHKHKLNIEHYQIVFQKHTRSVSKVSPK